MRWNHPREVSAECESVVQHVVLCGLRCACLNKRELYKETVDIVPNNSFLKQYHASELQLLSGRKAKALWFKASYCAQCATQSNCFIWDILSAVWDLRYFLPELFCPWRLAAAGRRRGRGWCWARARRRWWPRRRGRSWPRRRARPCCWTSSWGPRQSCAAASAVSWAGGGWRRT